MKFNPGINIGDELSNAEMRSVFQCGNMGGMRRSKNTGTLVIISDDTKGLYKDVWKNGILHYTGMGKIGDQILEGNQNKTLYESNTNGVEVHLFEVYKKAVYTYKGIVKLADAPYVDIQYDDNNQLRKVWMFPVKPVNDMQSVFEHEPSEELLNQLSDEELARRTKIKVVGKKVKKAESTVYYRDPYLKEMVKRIAEGKCQYCGNPAPFVDKNNLPYLEEHHVKQLADGGTDSIDNVVAICPNCHRRMHVLNDKSDQIILERIAKKNEKMLNRLLSYHNSYKQIKP